MCCREVERLLSDYIDDCLSEEMRDSVNRHMESCGRCSRSMGTMKKTITLLRSAEPWEPPQNYWERFWPALERRIACREEKRRTWMEDLWELVYARRPAAAVATVASAVVAGFMLFRALPVREEKRSPQIPPTVVRSSGRWAEGLIDFTPALPPSSVMPPAMVVSLGREDRMAVPEKGRIGPGWMGIGVGDFTPDLRARMGLPGASGVIVIGVVPSSPAARAGLKVGDLVQSFGAEQIRTPGQLARCVAGKAPGDRVPLLIFREGKEMKLELTVGRRKIE